MPDALHVNDAALLLARTWAIKIVWALVVLLIGWIVSSWLGARAGRALRRAHVEPTLASFLGGLLHWSILVVAGVSALGLLGLTTTSFAAVIGAVGVAVALALQGTLTSLAAGVLLLVFRPFKVGDTIKVGVQQGKVDSIDLFTIAIDTTDNRRVIVPNSAVFGQTIENLSFHPRRVVELAVPVPNAIDVEDARRALSDAIGGMPEALPEPAPEVQAYEVQAAQVMFRVRVWVATERVPTATDALVRATRRALDTAPKRA